MHTEEEAKKLWCPMARNEDGNMSIEDSHCIASSCAMWRWSEDAWLTTRTSKYDDRLRGGEARKEALNNPPVTSDMPRPVGALWEPVGVPESDEDGDPYFRQQWKRSSNPERKGYCGLAGKAAL